MHHNVQCKIILTIELRQFLNASKKVIYASNNNIEERNVYAD